MADQQSSRLSARRYQRFPDDRTPTHLLFPRHYQGPARILLRRLLIALILLFTTAIVVFVGRDGYRDSAGSTLSFLDALYYATVSLSTTGYGDIVPVTTGARIVNIVIVTPLRLMFLILLVGTTLEVLTTSARQQVRARRWRKTVRDHTVIIRYGTQGRAAAVALRSAGTPADKIAVIDADQRAANLAAEDGMTAICGDATTVHVLEEVEIGHAARAVIAANRDDTAVLATLTVAS